VRRQATKDHGQKHQKAVQIAKAVVDIILEGLKALIHLGKAPINTFTFMMVVAIGLMATLVKLL